MGVGGWGGAPARPRAGAGPAGRGAGAAASACGLERVPPEVPPAATLVASLGGPALWLVSALTLRRGRNLPGVPTMAGGMAFLSYSAAWALLRGSGLGSPVADLLLRDVPVTAFVLMLSLGVVEITASTPEAPAPRREPTGRCRVALVEADPAADWRGAVLEMVEETPGSRPVVFTRVGGRLDGLEVPSGEPAFVYLAEVRTPERLPGDRFVIPMEESFALNILRAIKRGSGPVFLIFDNVTDLIIMMGEEEAYSFVRGLLSALGPGDEAAFLVVPGAHPRRLLEGLGSLFQCRVGLGAERSYRGRRGAGG